MRDATERSGGVRGVWRDGWWGYPNGLTLQGLGPSCNKLYANDTKRHFEKGLWPYKENGATPEGSPVS
jgi:hypothetical protein